MKKFTVQFGILVALFVALIVMGCGGGGTSSSGTATGSTNSTGSTNGTLQPTPRLLAVDGSGNIVDPLNLITGQTVTFEVVTINPTTFQISVVPRAIFSTSDSTGKSGRLNASTGVFVASTIPTSISYLMTGTVGANNYSLPYKVNSTQATLTGTVNDSNGNAVPLVQLMFFDGNGNQVGAATTNLSGAFVASLPPSAVRFTFNPQTVPNQQNVLGVPSMAYYQVFAYGQGTYSFASSCAAPLPSLSVGSTTALPNTPIIFAQFTASGAAITPPPPAGCTP